MNKQLNRDLKSLNIRDYEDNSQHRQAMGYFKHTAYKLGISQAELLLMLQTKSIEQINREYHFKHGHAQEFSVKEIRNARNKKRN